MIESQTDVVVREVRIAARPETIFPFLTDPKQMVRWKGIEATLEPRPGGDYRVRLNDLHVARGQYLEVVPYSRVVFSWGWEGEGHPVPPGSSRVEITLTPDGSDTVVRLVHSGLPAAARESHGQGWDHFLPRLAIVIGGGDPGPDPMAQPPADDQPR